VSLKGGEIVGLIGPNGAGKSTILRCIAGTETPSSGVLTFNGFPLRLRSASAARKLGVRLLPQELDFFWQLSPGENWRLISGIRLRRAGADDPVLASLLAKHSHNLAPSEAQLISLDANLSTDASVLLLDEPTSLLDDDAARSLFHRLAKRKADGTIMIVSTHRLADLAGMNRWLFVDNGKISFETRSIAEANDYYLGLDGPSTIIPAHAGGTDAINPYDVRTNKEVDLLQPGKVVSLLSTPGSSTYLKGRALAATLRKNSANVVFLGPERRSDQIFPDLTIGQHIDLMFHHRINAEEYKRLGSLLEELGLSTRRAFLNGQITTLSGGNQQKLLVAIALIAPARFRILCEPLRGIDRQSSTIILRAIRETAARGEAILVCTLDEGVAFGVGDQVALLVGERVQHVERDSPRSILIEV
jgi:ribose transport system ATP-binding protein